MTDSADIEELLRGSRILLDVRCPEEYHRGHIPSALNLPLFTDDEHAEVGTLYKRKGRDAAFIRGLEIFGPKMRQLVETATSYARNKQVAVYCARGGMRSQTVGWLLDSAGFNIKTLKGGYKSYRKWTLDQFNVSREFILVGGSTGNGKTWILHALRKTGEQVLDLEALAGHRGSSFGGLGLPPQPTQEHFENKVAYFLHFFDKRPIWVEDESRMIGTCKVPDSLFLQMHSAPLFVVTRTRHDRINQLWSEYGHYPRADLREATRKISKRLGPERADEAVRLVEEGDVRGMIGIVLAYYDKAYKNALTRRPGPVYCITDEGYTLNKWAEILIHESQQSEFAKSSSPPMS